MTALTAKIIAMGLTGGAVLPAIVIIPALLLLTFYQVVRIIGSVPKNRLVKRLETP